MHPCLKRAAFHARLFKMAILVVSSFCVLTQISAQGTYSKIEASFNITSLATDPFDYTVTDVRVQILQPDNSTVSLPAFFDGGTTWRVRHTPTMAGTYNISGVTMNGSPLSVSNLQPTSWTVAGSPVDAGYIRVDPSNPRRFITSSGKRFFPRGEDVAWDANGHNVTNIFGKWARRMKTGRASGWIIGTAKIWIGRLTGRRFRPAS